MSRNRQIAAFTLMELLVVIAIVGILGGLIGSALKSPEGGAALKNAQRTTASLFKSLRLHAVSNQSPTRLVIHADPQDPEKFLRYLGVIYYDKIEEGWVAADTPSFLPKGVYFVPPPNSPQVDFGGLTVHSSFQHLESSFNKMELRDYPSTVVMSQSNGETYFFYECSALGHSLNKNADFLVAPGITEWDGEESKVTFSENEYAVEGFRIRQSGATAFFTVYEDIQ